MGAARIERGLQCRDKRHQPADRIVGAIRIGHMALTAAHDQRAVERAATAGLDGVADRLDIARLAENAVIEGLAALGRPFQELHGAVDRDALFVAGNQQRERAPLRLAAMRRKMIKGGGDKAGDAALHVDRAASEKLVAGDFAAERRMPPRPLVAGRHHVGMPGEDEVWLFAADAGVEVLDRRGAGLGESGAVHGKSGFAERILQISERAAIFRRHRTAADEIAGNGDGISGHEL